MIRTPSITRDALRVAPLAATDRVKETDPAWDWKEK